MTDDEMEILSAAMDEIYRLRRALAYEAAVVEAHLTLKSFPKSRRADAEAQVERMRIAVDSPNIAYASVSWSHMEAELRRVNEERTFLSIPSFTEEMQETKRLFSRVDV